MTEISFAKRIGPEGDKNCVGCQSCPDIWELENGDFAVIGVDISAAAPYLPPSAGCAPNEKIVMIPRELLIAAKEFIPSTC